MSKITSTSILLLVAVALASLMDGLDMSIINIALPEIASDFGVDTGSVSWAVVIYALMIAGTILIFGNIAERGNIKKILILGFATFTIASLICGLSTSLPMLILARFIQGLGAAMIIACAPLICVKFMPPQNLGLSFGVLATASSIGLAAGPALGGFLTHYLSWHWVFFINIPIGIFAIIYCLKIIPKETPVPATSFDWLGAAFLFATMASGVYTLERLPHLGISNPQIPLFAAVCIVSLILLCIHERRSKNPLINLSIFRHFNINAVLISFIILQVLYSGIVYLVPFYLTGAVQVDYLTSGMYLLIPAIASAIVSVPVSRWSDKTGRRWFMTAASAMFVIVSAIFAVIIPEWGLSMLFVSLVLVGVSIAIAVGPGSGRIVETMPIGEEEFGSTLMMTCGYLGGVLGTALYAMVFTFITSSNGEILSFTELPRELFLSGFHGTMVVGAVLACIALILSAVVKDVKRG